MKNIFKISSLLNLLNLENSAFTIKIVGTNAKGSTGRFLALMLSNEFNIKNNSIKIPALEPAKPGEFENYCAKFGWLKNKFIHTQPNGSKNPLNAPKIAHFSSPHVLSVYERFWANYLSASQIKERADSACAYLLKALNLLNLRAINEPNFFEFCCLMVPLVFYDADALVLEAGIGARFDSTAAFRADLSIITNISLDHLEYFKDLDEIKADKFSLNSPILSGIKCDELELLRHFNKSIFYADINPLDDYLSQNLCLAKAAFRLINAHEFNKVVCLDLLARKHLYKGALIDAAHNEAAIKQLLSELKEPKYFALALNSKKQNTQIIKALKPMAKGFYALNDVAKYELNAAKLKPQDIKNITKHLDEVVFCGSFEAARWAYRHI